MDIDVSLKKIEKNFSNKQNKLLQKIFVELAQRLLSERPRGFRP